MPVPQTYDFLVDTYGTERLKTLSVWSMFADADLAVRPHAVDRRGRSFLEQIHQCVSENLWFCNIHGIDVDAPPLPDAESLAFLRRYADAAARIYRAMCDGLDPTVINIVAGHLFVDGARLAAIDG